jgi:Fe-S-cluster containining protein
MDLSHFHCIGCHACCREPGYVRLKNDEPDTIASFLGLPVYQFIARYTILTKDRTGLSLVEKQDGACIFLTDAGCSINPVKPLQCRDFPQRWKFSGFETICGWAKKNR